MRRRLASVLGGLAAAVALLGAIGSIRADEVVPRYKLKPGQELKYRGTSDFNYERGSLGSEVDWQAWVVRANPDGSWRVVLRSSSKMTQKVDGKSQGAGHADASMGYCDVFPDGRVVGNETTAYRLDPSSLFPRLPADAAQAKAGWEATDEANDTRTAFKPLASEGGDWAFEGVPTSPMDKIYLTTTRSRYAFDVERGLIKRVENENTQGYGFNGKGTGTTELVSSGMVSPETAKALAEQSDRYFVANKAYQDALSRATKEPKEVEDILAKAEAGLKEARDAITLPAFRDQVEQQLKSHAAMTSYYTREAKDRAEVIGHDAADWEVKDLDGKDHSLKGYRGKVVILDFWYRGCGWCVRAMPQMKQLADDFKDKPVAVLGMNTDQKEEDARFVVEAMGLNYPSLKARGIPEKYKVTGFPTLIIIDPEGKVADIHVGYSPKLREEVGKVVEGLLARK